MKRARGRLLVICLAAVAAAFAVSGGSAGNRTSDVTFKYLPGDSFTYGETFATETKITNTGSSMFTQLEVHQLIPTAQGTPVELMGWSCPGDPVTVGGEVVCAFDQLSSKATLTVTFLWQAPPTGTGCAGCVSTDGYWIIKEGKPTNANEKFEFVDGAGPFLASLLGDDPSSERKKAGGYETEGVGVANCGPLVNNLHTNPTLSKDDPVSSAVCLPPNGFDIPSGSSALGYSSTITEVATKPSNGSHKELGQSIVCVAALGQACPPPGQVDPTPVNWGTEKARQIFRILQDAMKGPKVIAAVYHNGSKLPMCTEPDADSNADGCVVQIIPPQAGASQAIWTVIADAPTNGPWNW